MARCVPIVIILVAFIAASVVSYPQYGWPSASGGSAVGQFGQQEGSQETHNDKNFGFNYGSKQGSSSNFKNTAAQVGAEYGAGGWGSNSGYGASIPSHGWGR